MLGNDVIFGPAMGITPQFTDQPWNEAYDDIIDVRSQSEFALDHLPNAINLPVLNDTERAEVGTLYIQDSPFKARKLGAALVSRNIAQHLESHFADKPKPYRPLIYCWRGGQRSNSMALVLAQIGWPVSVLQGGYKTYRTYVRAQLAALPLQFKYRILCGLTGTAKTHLLQGIAPKAQVLDLEGLAHHRGSLLGQMAQPQPSQKYFETCLLQALQALDPQQPIWLEAESNKIGQIHLPAALWQQMQQSPCYEIRAPLASRVQWLIEQYPQWIEQTDQFKNKLMQLTPRYGKVRIQTWLTQIDQQNWSAVVASLLVEHYDPSYLRSLNRQYPHIIGSYNLPDLSADTLTQLQDQLLIIP